MSPLPGNPLILHVDTGRTWRGGQAQVLALCKGLRAAGVRQLLVAQPNSPLAERTARAGVEVVPLRMRGELDFWAARQLKHLIDSRAAALVHAHDAHAHALIRMATRRRPDVALVVSRRVDFDIATGLLSGRKYRDPRIHYLAISRGVQDVLVKGGIPAERITLVPSGVDESRFSRQVSRAKLREELCIAEEGTKRTERTKGAKADGTAIPAMADSSALASGSALTPGASWGPGAAPAPIVGTIGSLVDHKGHRYLVEAAPAVLQRYPAARFVIVGEGELRADLERRIGERRLSRAFYLPGHREDIETFLSGFDVFALPSHLEGLSTSLVDAMLFALPVVASRTGGVPDLVRDGETGLLVEPRNPEALAGAILRVLDDPGLARRLGQAARAHARANFTAREMVERTLAAYAGVLGRRNASAGE